MKSGTEWLSYKIAHAAERINSEDTVDAVFFVPFWRRAQLRHETADALTTLIERTRETGYELRGGESLANAQLVFVEPLVQAASITHEHDPQ